MFNSALLDPSDMAKVLLIFTRAKRQLRQMPSKATPSQDNIRIHQIQRPGDLHE